jgi:IMP dehydrogenase/GMP reductase
MALTQKDLEKIQEIVKDTVDFAITGSEGRLENIIEEKIGDAKKELKKDIAETKEELKNYIDKQTDDLAEINRAFIAKIDDHENRIISLEDKVLNMA